MRSGRILGLAFIIKKIGSLLPSMPKMHINYRLRSNVEVLMKSLVINDLISAFNVKDQWIYLGWHEIVSKYRRTKLGPLWLIIVNLVTIFCFSVVGSLLFKIEIRLFLPHVACGLFVWAYVSSILVDSCNIFTSQAYVLQNLNVNPIVFCLRLFIKNTLIFAHCLPVLCIMLILLRHTITLQSLLIFLTLPIFMATSFATSLILGILSARYRDISHMVQSLITIFPFITPIMWRTEMLGKNTIVANLNPVTHYIAIIRDPILGNPLPIMSYVITISLSVILCVIALYFYNKFKHRIVFWL